MEKHFFLLLCTDTSLVFGLISALNCLFAWSTLGLHYCYKKGNSAVYFCQPLDTHTSKAATTR